jgi:hypothetical protein
MKIVREDNFGDEGPGGSERVVREGLSQEEAEEVAKGMNDGEPAWSRDFYVVKPDDYVPWVFEP